MKSFLSTLLLLTSIISFANTASTNVVYGEDNRQDLYEVTNPLFKKLAVSTAAMVKKKYLLEGEEFYSSRINVTLEDGLGVCANEKFATQPILPNCSGFLVSEDTIVTAGHCADGDLIKNCEENLWVFDYKMDSYSKINQTEIKKENVYKCKKIIKQVLTRTEDFAVIKLERVVTGRKPLKFRTKGKVSDNAKLVVIGHPSMLPLKVSEGGTILRNFDKYKFTTNLDTFQGNSGSAVFNSETGLLEGILVSGKTDYIPSSEKDPKSCKIVNTCDMKGENCIGKDSGSIYTPGENVTRITTLIKYL